MMNHEVNIAKTNKGIELNLKLNNKQLFSAIIYKENIKVHFADLKIADELSNLFLNTVSQNDTIIIPSFLSIKLNSENMVISQNETFPKMFNCKLIVDSKFIIIQNLAISELELKGNYLVINKKIITQNITSCGNTVINHDGFLQSKNINIKGTFVNSGNVHCSTMYISDGICTNYDKAVIHSENLNINYVIFTNNGELYTNNFHQKNNNILLNSSEIPFLNNGTWNAHGNVIFNYIKIKNNGLITFTNVMLSDVNKNDKKLIDINKHGLLILDNTKNLMYQSYVNDGTWVFENVQSDNDIHITNNKIMYFNNNELNFSNIINKEKLIFSAGKYYTQKLNNSGLISFIDKQFTFGKAQKSISPHYLVFNECASIGSYEAEQNLNYFCHIKPVYITAKKNISFGLVSKKLTILKNINCSQTVSILVDNQVLNKNINILNINNLILVIQGDLTIGTDNKNICKIITNGSLTLNVHNINCSFGCIYGKKSTTINASGNIIVGQAISGGNYRYTYNGSFIASGKQLTINCNNYKNYYGQLYSHKKLKIKSKNVIENIAGSIISGNDIFIKCKTITNTRDNTYCAQVANWTWAYTDCKHNFESSDIAEIKSLGSIYFKVQNGTNLASTICAQKSIFYKTDEKYITNAPSTFTSTARYNYGTGRNDKVGYQTSDSPVSIYYSTIQSGKNISINTGVFNISSNLVSPIIEITANSGHFNNIARSRKNIITTKTIFIDLTELIQTQVANKKGFLKLTKNGAVKSDIISGKCKLQKSSITITDGNNEQLQNINYNNIIIFNPLENMPSDFFNLFIQSTLCEVSGKINIKNYNEKNLAKKLLSNADLFRNETNKVIMSKKDLYESAPYVMLLNELKKVNNILQSQTILCIPPHEINKFQSEGDIATDKFTCVTDNNQTHSNNRIVARDIINIISKNGSVIRKTDKYTIESCMDGKTTYEDISMPKQILFSNGDVNIKSCKDSIAIGADVFAKKTINEIADGNIISNPLLLQKVTIETKNCGNLFQNETTTMCSTNSAILSNNYGNKINRVGKNITTFANDIAQNKIKYVADNLNISGIILTNITKIFNEQSGISNVTKTTYQETAQFYSTKIKANKIVFNVKTVNLYGVNLDAKVLIDKSVNDTFIGPLIQEIHYMQQIESNLPLQSSNVGCKGGYEVALQSQIQVEKFIKVNSNKKIILNTVVYKKNKTEFIGNVYEYTQELQKWQTSWNIQSQIIPNEVLIIVSAAITYATYGMGATIFSASGIMGAMSSAGFTTLCNTAAIQLLKSGDPILVGKSLLTKNFTRNLAINIASAGICEHLGLNNLVNNNESLINFAKNNIFKFLINTPLNIIIGQQNIGDVLKYEAINCLVNTTQQFTAAQIGLMYQNNNLSFLQHKAVHALSGATTGGINNLLLNKNIIDGALAGAIGAVISEISGEFNLLNNDNINNVLISSKIIAGTVALLLKQDVELSMRTATNTVDYNLLPCLLAALTAIGATHIVYDTLNSYNEEGVDKAIETLIVKGVILGISKNIIHYGGKLINISTQQIYNNKFAQKHAKSLQHYLNIQEKMGEVGRTIATGNKIADVNRLIFTYGGRASDWVKKSSTLSTTNTGQKIELHWYENIKSGKRFEYKQKY